ncbi:MAG: DUF4301 family protein [Bacteroidales bacterium]|nr:DUF4301 family protein [Bacteroidales bacterium]
MFEQRDLDQFNSIGVSKEVVESQIELVNNGFSFLEIVAPATKERGIKVIDPSSKERLINLYINSDLSVSRFVPASGAATRMFKDLYEALDLLNKGASFALDSTVGIFFSSLKRFPFYDELKGISGFNPNRHSQIIELLLFDKGLNYGSLPKGLLSFHKYSNGSRTAFEEQLVESEKYAVNSNGCAKIMFTVSDDHLESFNNLYLKLKSKFKAERGVDPIVDFTLQKHSTDTVAVDLDGNPFRNDDGSILFRPGGHGALLGNLEQIDSDIVFIKNIDNVTKEELLEDTIEWKQIIAGMLIEVREKIFSYLKRLDGEFDDKLNKEIIQFLDEEFCISIPDIPKEILRDFLYAKLNRPIRVCGMVKNEGEPGGGPFIVQDADGSTSLQILESAQLDKSHLNYNKWMSGSTHFNPVDIVCSTINYLGEKFSLSRFTDPETGFVSIKSVQGRSLKALELPGLWNGAMSNWNTIFVEVPISTFNPVKSINDLLRQQHTGAKD